jgi:hypothetical protein
MHLYLTYSMVPELSQLAPREREIACYRALKMLGRWPRFFSNLPVLLCAIGGVVGAFAGSYSSAAILGHAKSPEALGCMMGVGLLGAIGGFSGRHIQLWKLRPYLRSVIYEHKQCAA